MLYGNFSLIPAAILLNLSKLSLDFIASASNCWRIAYFGLSGGILPLRYWLISSWVIAPWAGALALFNKSSVSLSLIPAVKRRFKFVSSSLNSLFFNALLYESTLSAKVVPPKNARLPCKPISTVVLAIPVAFLVKNSSGASCRSPCILASDHAEKVLASYSDKPGTVLPSNVVTV